MDVKFEINAGRCGGPDQCVAHLYLLMKDFAEPLTPHCLQAVALAGSLQARMTAPHPAGSCRVHQSGPLTLQAVAGSTSRGPCILQAVAEPALRVTTEASSKTIPDARYQAGACRNIRQGASKGREHGGEGTPSDPPQILWISTL